jgi:hypothetical protein
MPSPHQRAQPRVTYPADVRLYADRFDGHVSARSRDLGPSGIFVEAGERLAVGTPVVCEVALPSGPMRLAGLIAREQVLKAATGGEAARVGLGIQFVNIDERARAELESLIPRQQDERARQLVAIHLEGMKDALRSEALVTPEGLRVTATLPFLRDGGEVKVAFLSGSARVESRSVVRDARLLGPGVDGAPRLELTLQFMPAVAAPVPEPRFERDEVTEVTQVDTPSGIATAAQVDTPSGRATAALGEILTRDRALTRTASGEDPNNTVRVRAPLAAVTRRTSPAHTMSAIPVSGGDDTGRFMRPELSRPIGKRAALATLALAAGLALVAFGAVLNRFVIEGRAKSTAAAPGTGSAVVTARPLQGAVPEAVSAEPTRAAAAGPVAAVPPPAAPVENAPVPAADSKARAGTPRAAVPAPAPHEADEVQAAPQGEAAARVAHLPAGAAATPAGAAASGIVTLPVGTPGPVVTNEAGEIVAVVPVDGSTAGAVHYALTSPRGLAVDLPHARASLPIGRHAVFNDGFRFISIREREGGGLRLAFTYAYYTPRLLDVTIEEKAIRVRVAPAGSAAASGPPEAR